MQNPDPKVSVCIPTYNHEKYISHAIESVLKQETDFDYEIILGEDESQDGTREICVGYARRNPDRIRLFLRSRKDVIYINGSPTGRFNLIESYKAARGKYIAMLEGDDYWTDPLKLQKQADYLDNNPDCTLCFHNALRFDEKSQEFVGVEGPDEIKDKYQLSDLLNTFFPTCSTMYRNGLIKEFPDWFLRMPWGDNPLHILHAQHGAIGFINEVMGVHRIHPGGICTGLDDISRSLTIIIQLNFYIVFLPQYADLIQEQIDSRWEILVYHLKDKFYFEDIPNKNIRDEIHKTLENWPEDLALSPQKKKQLTRMLLQVTFFQYYKDKDYPSIRRTLLHNIRMNPKLFTNRGAISIYLEAFLGPDIANRIRSLSR